MNIIELKKTYDENIINMKNIYETKKSRKCQKKRIKMLEEQIENMELLYKKSYDEGLKDFRSKCQETIDKNTSMNEKKCSELEEKLILLEKENDEKIQLLLEKNKLQEEKLMKLKNEKREMELDIEKITEEKTKLITEHDYTIHNLKIEYNDSITTHREKVKDLLIRNSNLNNNITHNKKKLMGMEKSMNDEYNKVIKKLKKYYNGEVDKLKRENEQLTDTLNDLDKLYIDTNNKLDKLESDFNVLNDKYELSQKNISDWRKKYNKLVNK
jgi:chromosome segregation ATPase